MAGVEGVNFCTIRVDDSKCQRCYECVTACMNGALSLDKGIFVHNAYECANCEYCTDCCPNEAIRILEM